MSIEALGEQWTGDEICDAGRYEYQWTPKLENLLKSIPTPDSVCK